MAGSRSGSLRGAVRAWCSGLCLVAGLQLTGCTGGATSAGSPTQEAGGTLSLRQVCPGVHAAYDRLIAADPASAHVFEEIVQRLRTAADDPTRREVDPVVGAAHDLAAADRVAFPAARDQLYAAVSGLSRSCAAVDSPILHGGH